MRETTQPRVPLPDKQTGEKPPLGETGTALAIKEKILGAPAIPAGWGGARNRADRTSDHLTRQQCDMLMAAARRSAHMGCPFNRHWTVHYEKAGIAEHDGARFVGRLLKLAGDHARRKIGPFTAVWVRESGEGKGGHVHILMHLPARIDLRGKTRRWVRLAGGKNTTRVSRVRPIGGSLQCADSDSEHYRHSVGKVLSYVLKGASRDVGAALGLERCGERGLIVGKRCGRTQNVGSWNCCDH